jgi:uncharacterized protein (DUF433 family)
MSRTTTHEMASAPSLEGVIWTDPERMGGEPCFYGTRVPIKILFDYIEGGEPLEEFLEGFPPVTREQAVAVLEAAKSHLIQEIKAA